MPENPGLHLTFPPELLDLIADRVADRLADRLEPTSAEGYLTAEQAAEYLAAPIGRVRYLTRTGELRCYRDGRRVLYRRRDLDAVLATDDPEDRS